VGLEDPSRNGDGGGELEVGEAGELVLDEVVEKRVGRLDAVLAVSLELPGSRVKSWRSVSSFSISLPLMEIFWAVGRPRF